MFAEKFWFKEKSHHCKNKKTFFFLIFCLYIYKINTYQRNKERLQKLAQNCYYQRGGKEKAKEYYENNKERLQEQALH